MIRIIAETRTWIGMSLALGRLGKAAGGRTLPPLAQCCPRAAVEPIGGSAFEPVKAIWAAVGSIFLPGCNFVVSQRRVFPCKLSWLGSRVLVLSSCMPQLQKTKDKEYPPVERLIRLSRYVNRVCDTQRKYAHRSAGESYG